MPRSRFRTRSPYSPRLRENLRNALEVVRRGQGPVPVQPSTPDFRPELGSYVKLPGANFPPAGSIPVDVLDGATIAPGGTGTLITIPVPDTLRLKLIGIGFGAMDDIATGYLSWSLLLGPDPVQGYGSKLAAIGSIRQLAEISVVAAASQTLNLRAVIAATAPIPYLYYARVRGWLYNEKD